MSSWICPAQRFSPPPDPPRPLLPTNLEHSAGTTVKAIISEQTSAKLTTYANC